MIDGYGVPIRLEGEFFAYGPWRSCIGIPVEPYGKIFVDKEGESFSGVGKEGGQWVQRHPFETLHRAFTGSLMNPAIGHLAEPLLHLFLHVRDIFKGPQGPKVPAHVLNRPFDFSFLIGRPNLAGPGDDFEGPQEVEERFIKPDEGALPFKDCGEHIIDEEMCRRSCEEEKRLEEALVKAGLFLAVRKIDIEHSAAGFHDHQGIKLPIGVSIRQGSKMAPVYLHLISWRRFETNEGLAFVLPASFLPEIVSQDGDFSIKSLSGNLLQDYRGADKGVFLKKLIDKVVIKVQFGYSLFVSGEGLLRVFQVFFDGLSCRSQLSGDFAF